MKIPDFSKARVLVVGDVILDKYWHGNSDRISPEAPVPVVSVQGTDLHAGGASNVALNLAALGSCVKLLGITGDDDNSVTLQRLLSAKNVDCHFLKETNYNTIIKLRVIAQHQQMIRLDFEDNFSSIDKQELLTRYSQLIDNVDVVVLSDYAKGTLNNVSALISIANKAGKKVIVDPKGADFSKYRGATVITPNRREFEGAAGHYLNNGELEKKANALREKLSLDALLVTQGDEGMSLIRQGCELFHLSADAKEVFDVTGAGDTVVGTLAAALAVGSDMQDAVIIANLAAGLVVRKLGTATTSPTEIRHALQEKNSDSLLGVLDEDELQQVIQVARSKGERVIMTNGCFDIVHIGHITCLQKAKELGDRLVVAVNTDESVRMLKGDTRPINLLDDRMGLLAELKCVDWVVSFDDKTPERLYCKILPDVVIKGGDYKLAEVDGVDCVKANGGVVQIVDFAKGHSTTDLINKIRVS